MFRNLVVPANNLSESDIDASVLDDSLCGVWTSIYCDFVSVFGKSSYYELW